MSDFYPSRRSHKRRLFSVLILALCSVLLPSYSALWLTSAQTSSTIQFNAAAFSVNEGNDRATLTVVRTGDTSGVASVEYMTLDNMNPVRCDVVSGSSHPWCDYSTRIDTLRFAGGEIQKTFTVPITNDAYVEGAETLNLSLLNPSGAILGAQVTTVLTRPPSAAANPQISRKAKSAAKPGRSTTVYLSPRACSSVPGFRAAHCSRPSWTGSPAGPVKLPSTETARTKITCSTCSASRICG